MLDLLSKLEATPNGTIFPRDGSIVVEGSAQSWAYAAAAPIDGDGPAVIKAVVKLSSGSMSIGLLSKAQDRFLLERSIPITGDFASIEIPVAELGDSGGLIIRTFEDGRTKPQLELKQLLLEPQVATDQETIEVDPIVENLWPLQTAVFNIASMRHWSRKTLEAALTGDAWNDNLILNKWEFATGATRLESFPWRFSVPFVLCNARCEFCSAWLVKGRPMPIDLLDRLNAVLPYVAQVDMVGWGEPLIHPEFGDILKRFQLRADPRARIALTTNGVHLQKWADRLIEANVRDLAISIHAASGATHEDLMGLPHGAFDRVLSGIRAVSAYRSSIPNLSVGLVFIVMRQNINEIPQFLTMAEELNVTSIFLRTLKSRTPEEHRKDSLDYQRLPPYLHPDFEAARQRAVKAIAACKIPIESAPETWSARVFPAEFEEEILAAPLTPREVRQNSKSYYRTTRPDSERLPIGQPLPAPGAMLDLLDKLEATPSGAIFSTGGSLVVEGSVQPWANAASVAFGQHSSNSAWSSVALQGPAVVRVLVRLANGSMSIGVFSKAKDRFLIERSIPISGDFVSLEVPVAELGDSVDLIFRTCDPLGRSVEEIVDAGTKPRLELKQLLLEPQVATDPETIEVDPIVENLWLAPKTEVIHERLENPYDRAPPMFCPSPYTALYVNGFDREVSPCCYMTQVPGHEKSYLRKGASFDDVWNSPAMMALRKTLNEGPLMQPCLKCAFYW